MTLTRSMTPLTYDDIVYVRNAGEEPIHGKLSPTKRFVIPPQKTKLMSWADACMCFGNPFEANADERDRRHIQVMCLYGAFDQRLDAHLLPQIEVTTEDGQRVYMLIEDPSGRSNVSETVEDDFGDPRLARINAMLAEAARLKTEIMMEHQVDPNGRPIAQAGSNPQGERNRTNAAATLDSSVMTGGGYVAPTGERFDGLSRVSAMEMPGQMPADFRTAQYGAAPVAGDLIPTGDPAAHRLPRPASWDLPANQDYVEHATQAPGPVHPVNTPAAPLAPADLLIPSQPQQPASGPRREGLIIPRQA